MLMRAGGAREVPCKSLKSLGRVVIAGCPGGDLEVLEIITFFKRGVVSIYTTYIYPGLLPAPDIITGGERHG